MPKFKLVVFDLDGTLVDSGSHIIALLNVMRRRLNKSALSFHDAIPVLSLGGEKIISSILEVSDPDIQKYLQEFRQLYRDLPTPQDCVYPGVVDLLDELSYRGFLLSICTNKARILVDKVLGELSLDRFFSVICADGDLPSKKPDPANLHYCLNAFGVGADQTLMVGDSRVDQQLAQSCGASFAWFAQGNNDGVLVDQVAFQFGDFSELKLWLTQ